MRGTISAYSKEDVPIRSTCAAFVVEKTINVNTVSILATEYRPVATRCAPYQNIRATESRCKMKFVPFEKYAIPSRNPKTAPTQNAFCSAIPRARLASRLNFPSKYLSNPSPITALIFLVASCSTDDDLSTCRDTLPSHRSQTAR